MLTILASLSTILALAAKPPEKTGTAELYGVFHLDNGLVLPYPLDDLFRGWTDCAGSPGGHRALDIGGVGPDHGVGTPIRAIARSRVIAFATTKTDPERCGPPLTSSPRTIRGGVDFPTYRDIPGYGRVYFFSAAYGRYRSGGYITLQVIDGPYKGYVYRYMHLAATHPRLAVGDVVEAGDEVALLGGTAVQDSWPHVHMQLEDPRGRQIELGELFGVGSTHVTCEWGNRVQNPVRAAYTVAAIKLMRRLREDVRLGRQVAANHHRGASASANDSESDSASAKENDRGPSTCGTWSVSGNFKNSLSTAITLPAEIARLDAPWQFSLNRTDKGNWTPRLQVLDPKGQALFSGTKATRAAAHKWAFNSKKSGTKGGVAEVEVKPHADLPLVVSVEAWPAGPAAKMKEWLKDARWRLDLSRPCRALPPRPERPKPPKLAKPPKLPKSPETDPPSPEPEPPGTDTPNPADGHADGHADEHPGSQAEDPPDEPVPAVPPVPTTPVPPATPAPDVPDEPPAPEVPEVPELDPE